MKELELTSNAALTDAVYETALNGSFLEVKLVAGSPWAMTNLEECNRNMNVITSAIRTKKTQFCSSNLWMLPMTK